jgi:hypothetical protein
VETFFTKSRLEGNERKFHYALEPARRKEYCPTPNKDSARLVRVLARKIGFGIWNVELFVKTMTKKRRVASFLTREEFFGVFLAALPNAKIERETHDVTLCRRSTIVEIKSPSHFTIKERERERETYLVGLFLVSFSQSAHHLEKQAIFTKKKQ